jgi:hypothetical protein
MKDLEKLHHQKNRLGHPTIEDISVQHHHFLNDLLSFRSQNIIDIENATISPLSTPNDVYREYLLKRLKTDKENSTEE